LLLILSPSIAAPRREKSKWKMEHTKNASNIINHLQFIAPHTADTTISYDDNNKTAYIVFATNT